MELLGNLSLGAEVAFTATNLLHCFTGVFLGTVIGVLPGVGPLVTIAVLLPMTYGLTPESALIMLAGIYYGAQYGGSTTAILIRLPGESSSAVTCIDGYEMTRAGRGGPALAIAAISSLIAGCIGTLLIAVFGPLLTKVGLSFGGAEYTSLLVMALVTTAAPSNSLLKGIGLALCGIIIGLVGIDVNSGTRRFTFDIPQLAAGIDFVVIAIGLFAFPEIIRNIEDPEEREIMKSKIGRLMPTREDVRRFFLPSLRGTGLGAFFGILPGTGPTISSFAAYMLEKSISRTPSRFGKGAVEGVAAPEAANNAAAQTAFIPTLSLGVPGSPTMALMLGALMIHGIAPGPNVVTDHPNLFWGLVVSMWIGNAMLVGLNLPLVGLWTAMLKLPYRWLYPLIIVLSSVGVYSLNLSEFEVIEAAVFGLLGYALMRLHCDPAPFILGFMLGPMLEENFRRALLVSGGDFTIFVSHPISLAFLLAALLIVAFMLVGRWFYTLPADNSR